MEQKVKNSNEFFETVNKKSNIQKTKPDFISEEKWLDYYNNKGIALIAEKVND